MTCILQGLTVNNKPPKPGPGDRTPILINAADTAEAAIRKTGQLGNVKHYWQKVLHAINQFALPRTRRLERELSAVVEENRSLTAQLDRVRNEFESTRSRDRHEIAEFGHRVAGLETERDTAHRQLHVLEALLEEASTHQQSTAAHVVRLEDRLNEEHAKHESILGTMQATLDQVQNKQQSLLQFQSDLDDSLRKTRRYLLEAIHAESARPQKYVFAMVLVAGLFLLGALAGATSMWTVRQDLLELSAASKDLRLSIEAHISQHEMAFTGSPAGANDRGMARLDDTINPDPMDKTVNPDRADQARTGMRAGEAGSAGLIAARPVSLSHTGPGSVKQEISVSRPARINGHSRGDDNEAGEWGPPLQLAGTGERDQAGTSDFDPLVKELQTNLLVLGFDLGHAGADGFAGAQTEQALQEFQLLYQPVMGARQKTDADYPARHVRRFADLAREDEKRFGIDSGVLAAIRLSSLRTGVDFSFLMELAEAESTFDSDSRALKSSAAGLYQFKEGTWLDTIKRHGAKYGIESYLSQVEYIVDSDGNRQPMISDPVVYRHVLDLRHNPRMSALMAAEYLKDNMRRLSSSIDVEPGRTEMYLTHFLGLSGTITFLELLDRNPDKVASDIFPGPAARNRNIFHAENRKPRTVAEVYDVFYRKFNTSRYKDWRTN
mgnify:CR=1 FL=1